MKTAIFLLIVLAGTVTYFLLRSGSAANNLSTETFSFEGKSMPFNLAYEQLQSGLLENHRTQLLVLTALDRQPLLVKGTPLLHSIVKLAIAGEDYSRLDAVIIEKRATQSDEPPTNPAILDIMDRAGVRGLALQIAVANGSPEAINLLPILEKSKSPTEQAIAKEAAHFLNLYGTPNKPKRGPFVLFTKEVSEEAYAIAINERYNSPDIKRQISAVESIVGNLNFQMGKEDSTNFLIKLLRPFFSKHKGTTNISVGHRDNRGVFIRDKMWD